jgi:hypothetical protein
LGKIDYLPTKFMGSFIEINDTLQITDQQGFPSELIYDKHVVRPFLAEDFKNKVFEFKNKKGIRFYHVPPVRVFLAQNIEGKWLYWGHIHITEIKHDYINKTTFGKFIIVYIYSPEEMKAAHKILDRNSNTNYFNL